MVSCAWTLVFETALPTSVTFAQSCATAGILKIARGTKRLNIFNRVLIIITVLSHPAESRAIVVSAFKIPPSWLRTAKLLPT
jgi:hypothetical protein